ncbi:MAG TPA: hypothetical protein VL326_21135 [Kofleriaceae bacterium]|nr:hypothetical protein [Kofleriaceae bacterium]
MAKPSEHRVTRWLARVRKPFAAAHHAGANGLAVSARYFLRRAQLR